MMIGKTEGTSASFVDYQVNTHTDKDGNRAANVSEAIRGKTIGERNQNVLDAAQKKDSAAYTVHISPATKNMLTYGSGASIQIGFGIGTTREDELNALKKNIELYQRMNENYRLTGSPTSPEEEKNRMDAVLAKFPTGLPGTSQTAELNGVTLKQQDFGAVLKTPIGLEDFSASKTAYIPVTEIRTQHYKWTEENGIEETISREEEIAGKKASMQKELAADIGKSIESILTPYETYEEAQEALHDRQTISGWYSMDENTLSVDMTLKSARGAFGILANQLNNYLEEFGEKDRFFQNLSAALNELDPQNENDLLNQIRNMVRSVQRGNAIDTESKQFKEDVEKAVASFYSITNRKVQEPEQKKAKDVAPDQQNMTFLDMQRRAAEEEGDLLDELLGRDHDDGFESAGDILANRRTGEKDAEFTDNIRHLDEKEEPRKPLEFKTPKSEQKGTRLSEAEIKKQQAFHDAWTSISEKLVGKMTESATDVMKNHVDVLA